MGKHLIDPETVKKHAYLPVKLSELSRINPGFALRILQEWGEGKKPVLQLWDEVLRELNQVS